MAMLLLEYGGAILISLGDSEERGDRDILCGFPLDGTSLSGTLTAICAEVKVPEAIPWALVQGETLEPLVTLVQRGSTTLS